MSYKTRLFLVPAIAAALTLTACSSPTVKESEEPAAAETDVTVEEEAPAKEVGTRSNPAPIGSEIVDGDWTVRIESVNLDAGDAIASSNEFNEPAADGNVYILVTASLAYNGTEDAGEHAFATIDYVTVDGNTISQAYVDTSGTGAKDFTLLDPLYPGATHTGVLAFEVPAASAGEGVLVVTPSMMSDRMFAAVK